MLEQSADEAAVEEWMSMAERMIQLVPFAAEF
jgi:hypothetical protein